VLSRPERQHEAGGRWRAGRRRFGSYVELLGGALGHADRRGPLRAYATGLLLPGERKSLEPMAAGLWRDLGDDGLRRVAYRGG
jgi:SRSO17 transposase